MAAEWRRLCRSRQFSVSVNDVLVDLHGGRRHRVTIDDMGDAYRLSGVVARAGMAEGVKGLPIRTWERNRGTELVGFRLDKRGRLIGESWVPKAGLSAAEFQLYLSTVAALGCTCGKVDEDRHALVAQLGQLQPG